AGEATPASLGEREFDTRTKGPNSKNENSIIRQEEPWIVAASFFLPIGKQKTKKLTSLWIKEICLFRSPKRREYPANRLHRYSISRPSTSEKNGRRFLMSVSTSIQGSLKFITLIRV